MKSFSKSWYNRTRPWNILPSLTDIKKIETQKETIINVIPETVSGSWNNYWPYLYLDISFIFPKFSRFFNQKNWMSKNKIAILFSQSSQDSVVKKIKCWKIKYIQVTWLKNTWWEITFPKGRLPVLSSGKETMWVQCCAHLSCVLHFKNS